MQLLAGKYTEFERYLQQYQVDVLLRFSFFPNKTLDITF